MSRRGRFFLGGTTAVLAVAVGCVLGTSLNVTVAPVSEAGASEEGPLTPVATPTPDVTPTPTVEVVPPAPAIEVTPTPSASAEPVAEGPADAEPWALPCTDWIADHGGPVCKGEPITWPFSNGETLVCGPNAKPALDYSHDEVGWWAYCEPALADSAEGPLAGFLPECETEDSDNCVWYADTRGNGEGQSFIAYEGQTYVLTP